MIDNRNLYGERLTSQILQSDRFEKIIMIILFISGIFHWLYFFNMGYISLSAYDWPKEYGYYSIIQQAVKDLMIPWHAESRFFMTNRFLGIPEINFSPQIILLRWIDIKSFIILNTVLCYCIGYWGMLCLKKRFNLTLLPFTLLFLLFNFNGYITSHIAVGHSMWNGYFFLPWFFSILFEMVISSTAQISFRMALALSFILYSIFLQGALHLLVWLLLFLTLFSIANLEYIKTYLIIVSGTILFSAHRLMPAVLTFWKTRHDFISGYPTLMDLVDAFTRIRSWRFPEIGGGYGTLGWWEYDVFIGVTGFIFLASCMLFSLISTPEKYNFNKFYIPIIAMCLLSIGDTYSIIAKLPFPLFSSERASSRFIIIPMVWSIFISTIRFKDLLDTIVSHFIYKIVIISVGFMIIELSVHSRLWQMATIEQDFNGRSLLPSNLIIIADPIYKMIVILGFFISLITLIGFMLKCVKLNRITNVNS